MQSSVHEYAEQWRKHVDETGDGIRWGTIAHTRNGDDISREDGDFFYVDEEKEDSYIGRWLTGYGFVEVTFPKRTTRKLTWTERSWLRDNPVVM